MILERGKWILEMNIYDMKSPYLDQLLILKRIADRGKEIFYRKGSSRGIDMFEHLGQEIERLALEIHKDYEQLHSV